MIDKGSIGCFQIMVFRLYGHLNIRTTHCTFFVVFLFVKKNNGHYNFEITSIISTLSCADSVVLFYVSFSTDPVALHPMQTIVKVNLFMYTQCNFVSLISTKKFVFQSPCCHCKECVAIGEKIQIMRWQSDVKKGNNVFLYEFMSAFISKKTKLNKLQPVFQNTQSRE